MEPTEYFILILFIALGIFSVIAAILNLDWYFQTSGAMTFVRWLGRKGARIFYALLGLGDAITVKVAQANLERKQLDFALV